MNVIENDALDTSADDSQSKRMLNIFAKSWPTRAQVKKEELSPFFEEGKEDFLEELLPFRNHLQYKNAPDSLKSKALTCGWLLYNAKTVQIETEIVNPACSHITAGKLPGLDHPVAQLAASETMVDEIYHLHLVEAANRMTKKWRGIGRIDIPQFNLVNYMKLHQEATSTQWRKEMIQFSTAVVSEIFISDYLHLLSESEEIQAFNRETIAAHRHDEMAHSPLFRSFAKIYFYSLNEEQQAAFADILPRPVIWFADRELDVWNALLKQIEFPGADVMIRET
jgi:alpha-N-dichloroacetyl-p-aminophenylserinol N-oxygenase